MNQMNNQMMMGNQLNNPMMMGNQLNNPMMMGNQLNNPMMMGNQMNNQMMMENQLNNPMMMGNQMNNQMMMGNQMNQMMMENQMNQMMMADQMNQMMMGMLQNINQQKDNEEAILIKVKGLKDSKKDIELTIDPKKKVRCLSDILNLDHSYLFIFNGKKIKEDLNFYENGILNNSIIFVVETKGMKGGEVGSCAKSIADPTKKAPVEWPTSKDGPFYLTVKNGINIFGFCQNKECQAYKKEVCSPFGYGTFDLIEDLNSKSKKCPKCPACEFLLLEIESCGFMNCEYYYIGKKYENKKLIDVNFSKKTKGGYKAIDYIDPGKKGENKSTWVELLIKAKKLKK